jgi:transposase
MGPQVDLHGSAGTVMLGLEGFVLLGVSSAYGELEQVIETNQVTAWCEGCGVQAAAHGRRRTSVRDLPSAGRPVTLVWLKRLWRCPEPACQVRTWSETTEDIRPRSSLTERARREACRLVGEDRQTVLSVAVLLGVGWATIMRAVWEYGAPLVEDPARMKGVTSFGVDETAFLAANQYRSTEFITGIVALPGPGRAHAQLLDVLPGRTKAVVSQWISARPEPWRGRIQTCALDPYRGYATALSSSLPHATRVLDPFHVVRLGQAAIDESGRDPQAGAAADPRPARARDDPLYP